MAKDTRLDEGMVRKGGKGEKPSTPPPSSPPRGQKPPSPPAPPLSPPPTPSTMYFVINNSSGDTTVTPMTEADLLKKLEDEWWGPEPTFLDNEDGQGDTNYWRESGLLIIKGEVCIPKPKDVVKSYEF